MESVLEKLLVADSTCVQEGTAELKKIFTDPAGLSALCDLLVNCQRAEIRKLTAVLLRRKFSKRRFWTKLPADTRRGIKSGLLATLANEADLSVKSAIAQLIGQLAKYELADDLWPELLQFIFTLCSSDNIAEREFGMYTLSITSGMCHGSFMKYFDSLGPLFLNTLKSIDDFSSNIAYHTLISMKNLTPTIVNHKQMVNIYHELLPSLLEIMKANAFADENKAVESLGLLEDLMDYVSAIIIPHIRNVIEMCLRICCDNSISTDVQVKAIGVVGWLVRTKGKAIMKHQLVNPIIDVVMELMARTGDNEDEEYFTGDADQMTPVTAASQTFDLIALNIPADKVVYYILEKIEPHIQGNDPCRKKAAFLCLAILSEGCSECIRKRYLEAFVNCVCEAIKDNSTLVKNAAFFALGQFSEHLQPEISQYSEKLMPLLFEFLNHVYYVMETEKIEPNGLDRLFYAIGTFCETLGNGLLPYLPVLMEKIFLGLNPQGFSLELKKSCFNVLQAVVSAVKSEIMPYFNRILELLRIYIESVPVIGIPTLQSCALDTLAVVAEGVGEQHFKPLARGTLEMSLSLIDTYDPDLRKAIFAVFAAMSIIMKDEIVDALPVMIHEIIATLENSDGVVMFPKDEDVANQCDIFFTSSDSEENSDEEDIGSEDSEDVEPGQYLVENPFIEEKEQACLTLKEICSQTSSAFLPYLQKCCEEVFKLTTFPQEHIRRAAIETILQFCITLHQINTVDTKEALYKVLQLFIPKCAEIIRLEEEKGIVQAGLDAYASLLMEIKGDAFVGDGHREAIMNSVIDILTHKTVCQDTDLDVVKTVEDIEESTEAEQDEILLESACDIIPKYGKSLNPVDFAQYFRNILQLLSLRTMKHQSISQRSFSYGTLAECMSCISTYVEPYVPKLMELWMRGMKDNSGEVRNNAVFGLGEMILHGQEKITSYYPEILQAFSSLVSKETHQGTVDNTLGAIAKMMIINYNGIPLDQVFPVFLDRLPLKVDYEENEAVVKALSLLFNQRSPLLEQNIDKVTRILVHIVIENQIPNDATKNVLKELLRSINDLFSAEFKVVVSELTQEKLATLLQVLE